MIIPSRTPFQKVNTLHQLSSNLCHKVTQIWYAQRTKIAKKIYYILQPKGIKENIDGRKGRSNLFKLETTMVCESKRIENVHPISVERKWYTRWIFCTRQFSKYCDMQRNYIVDNLQHMSRSELQVYPNLSKFMDLFYIQCLNVLYVKSLRDPTYYFCNKSSQLIKVLLNTW